MQIRFVNPDEQKVRAISEELTAYSNSSRFENGLLKLATVLLIDAVQMYHQTLTHLNNIEAKTVDCNTGDYWEHGHSLINIIKTVRVS